MARAARNATALKSAIPERASHWKEGKIAAWVGLDSGQWSSFLCFHCQDYWLPAAHVSLSFWLGFWIEVCHVFRKYKFHFWETKLDWERLQCKGRQGDAWRLVRCGLVLGRWCGPAPRSAWVGTQAAGKPDPGRKRPQALRLRTRPTGRAGCLLTPLPCILQLLFVNCRSGSFSPNVSQAYIARGLPSCRFIPRLKGLRAILWRGLQAGPFYCFTVYSIYILSTMTEVHKLVIYLILFSTFPIVYFLL